MLANRGDKSLTELLFTSLGPITVLVHSMKMPSPSHTPPRMAAVTNSQSVFVSTSYTRELMSEGTGTYWVYKGSPAQ